MNRKTSITILGLGNILLGDEGFGVHFIRWLSKKYRFPTDVEIVDGGTLGYLLLDTICRCQYLIVIDAIKIDDVPGSIYRFTRKEMEFYLPPPTSAHEVTFPDILLKAELLGELPETVFICAVPKTISQMNTCISDLMREKFGAVEEVLLKELLFWGIAARKIADA